MSDIERLRAEVEALKLIVAAVIGSLPNESRANTLRYVEATRAAYADVLLNSKMSDQQLALMDAVVKAVAPP